MENNKDNNNNTFSLNIGGGFVFSDLFKKKTTNTSSMENTIKPTSSSSSSYYPFKLPIQYLPDSIVSPLKPSVIADLELVESPETPMYHYLFQPTHEFSLNMLKEWKKQITTDVVFLKETQDVLKDMDEIKKVQILPVDDSMVVVDTDKLMNIWRDLKEDSHFLEKYSYIEFDYLKNLNNSETFLHTITLANLISPLISFLIPIIFLILPFIILKIRGFTFNLNTYITILKDLAKNHFIGKTLRSFETSFQWNKLVYLFFSFAMYLMQIYNNAISCWRFHKNIKKINAQLEYLYLFSKNSCIQMDTFVKLHGTKTTYRDFCKDIVQHSTVLNEIQNKLKIITPFTNSFSKINQFGYLLKTYYELHSNVEYGNALLFSFGFEGYIHNMKGIYDNLQTNNLHFATFDSLNTGVSNTNISIKQQYYPSHKIKHSVKNDFKLSSKEESQPNNKKEKENKKIKTKQKGIIITGPNASGKTTFLKTTALNIIFTQQVGVGFYEKCKISKLYKQIHSYLNIPDTSERDSLFQAESKRCKEIIECIETNEITDRHFCIFDELYSGTNPTEATKASFCFLKYLSKMKNVHFILTTHYTDICKKFETTNYTGVDNYKMNVEFNAADSNVDSNVDSNSNANNTADNGINNNTDIKNNTNFTNDKMIYTYKLKKGVSKIEGAYSILKSLKYPKEMLNMWNLF
jgi:hypothetical protein